MPPLDQSLPSEAFFGAVYGFGLSAALWAGTSADTWFHGGGVSLMVLALAAGPLRLRLRRGWRLTAPLPFALAAAIMAGGAASVLVAAAAGVTTGLVEGRPGGGWGRARAAAFHAGSAALAAASAAAAVRLVGQGVHPGLSTPGATTAWIAAWVLVHGVLTAGAIALSTDLNGWRTLGRIAWVEVRSGLLHVPVGLLLPMLLAAAWGPPALAGAIVALLAYRHGRRPLERWLPVARAAAPPGTIYRSITMALARALAAGDDTTGEHLQRVRRLCLRIGSRLGMTGEELEALGAAALLHDVGRIAVPDRIRAKPGRLTDEELARVRIHPAVGAEIVRALRFPYPVHPIVRHHHERWDGTGYPDRLHGEEIPYGARILAAVHAFDSLVSNRPYRGALDREAALRTVRRDSGLAFDPLVVDLLAEELERETPEHAAAPHVDEPAAERRASAAAVHMQAADRRLETLYDIRRLAAAALPSRDRLAAAARRIDELVPHDAIAVWSDDGAIFADGTGREWLLTAPVEADGGLAAAALAERRAADGAPLWTRDASPDDGVAPGALTELAHGAVAPLVDDDRTVGVLAVYRRERAFDEEERRTLAAAAGALTPALRTARGPGSPQTVLTDPATGLPNANFLRFEAAHRFAGTTSAAARSGVIAVRVCGLSDLVATGGERSGEQALAGIGRRLAAALGPGETLVRHGLDVLLVLTPAWRPDALVRRAQELEHAADVAALRPRTAHVAFPLDGGDLPTLLAALGRRLDETVGRSRAIVPFRAAAARAS